MSKFKTIHGCHCRGCGDHMECYQPSDFRTDLPEDVGIHWFCEFCCKEIFSIDIRKDITIYGWKVNE